MMTVALIDAMFYGGILIFVSLESWECAWRWF